MFFGQEVHYYMVYIAYFMFHISYCIFHIFLDKGFPKGGGVGGPTFGKNSQIISFFLFDSVPQGMLDRPGQTETIASFTSRAS